MQHLRRLVIAPRVQCVGQVATGKLGGGTNRKRNRLGNLAGNPDRHGGGQGHCDQQQHDDAPFGARIGLLRTHMCGLGALCIQRTHVFQILEQRAKGLARVPIEQFGRGQSLRRSDVGHGQQFGADFIVGSQALAIGLPVLLFSWGGDQGFKLFANFYQLLLVRSNAVGLDLLLFCSHCHGVLRFSLAKVIEQPLHGATVLDAGQPVAGHFFGVRVDTSQLCQCKGANRGGQQHHDQKGATQLDADLCI